MITKPADNPWETGAGQTPQALPRVDERPSVPAQNGAAQDVSAPTERRHLWPWFLIAALAAGAWYTQPHWLPFVAPGLAKGSAVPSKGGKPIPVRTAAVERRDIPLYINGLGTVTSFKTVTIRSRVDGEVLKVAFTEGQMVHEGDLLAEIDARLFQAQLQQAQGTLAKDEAALQLAKLTLIRGQDLFKKNSISQQEIDTETAQVQTMEGTVQTDQAMVDTAKLQITYCRIIAPISGRIGLRLVDQGNIVHANDLTGMAVITQLQPIALVFPISHDEIPRVQKQMHAGANLTVYAYDRNFKTKLATGKLEAIDSQVDVTTGTVRLKAVFDNDDGMLFPNQFVNARLLVDTQRDAIVIPSAARQSGPGFSFVYVVRPDETVEMRRVEVGPSEGADTIILTGLAPGEVVVTDGIDKLKEDSKVSTKDSEKDSPKGAEQSPEKATEKATAHDRTKGRAKDRATHSRPDQNAGKSAEGSG